MNAHEFEDPDGIFPVSRANQAAAFARIARCRALLGAQAPKPPPADETVCEKLLRLTGRDLGLCPACGEGRMEVMAELDPTRFIGFDSPPPGSTAREGRARIDRRKRDPVAARPARAKGRARADRRIARRLPTDRTTPCSRASPEPAQTLPAPPDRGDREIAPPD